MIGGSRNTAKLAPSIRAAERHHSECDLEVDGGIDATTAPLVVRAGATALVAGSAIFGDGQGVASAMNRLWAALKDIEHEGRAP